MVKKLLKYQKEFQLTLWGSNFKDIRAKQMYFVSDWYAATRSIFTLKMKILSDWVKLVVFKGPGIKVLDKTPENVFTFFRFW